ncbi:MAG: alkaline phosphatase family protein, partial [Clostridia bacterium]|nr:alkaline phosphatase family protein [Clostridia bacterium]
GEPTPTTPYKHVVVIGVDGAGAFFRDAQTPNLDKIFAKGAITYKMLSADPTISAQCWGSMLHGVTPEYHRLTNGIVESRAYPSDSLFPSFFKVIRDNNPDAVLASFTNWNPINVGIVEDDIGVYKKGGIGDAALTQEIVAYMADHDPTALFVQFDEADGAGHAGGYGTQTHLDKITELDGYIGQIYEAYAEKGLLDETLFIVTSDHGGNGNSHGGLTDGEKYVMFAACGKSVRKGTIGDIEIRDTAAIVLYALGYDCPETWTARVPSGLFKGVTAKARPVYEGPASNREHINQPTPTEDVSQSVKVPLKVYLPFDGNVADRKGGATSQSGKLYFVEGYYGQGVSLDDGYVSVEDFKPGKDSFSISMWIKTEGTEGDPVLLSNKDWNSGLNPGFVLSLRNTEDIVFNAGNGAVRMDLGAFMPLDYNEGWMHLLLIVDRTAGKVSLQYDFGAVTTVDIPDALKQVSFDGLGGLNIGQDGTGKYSCALPATVDDLMIFDGVLDAEDVAALAKYYGKKG